jgi:hypothetical protein
VTQPPWLINSELFNIFAIRCPGDKPLKESAMCSPG